MPSPNHRRRRSSTGPGPWRSHGGGGSQNDANAEGGDTTAESGDATGGGLGAADADGGDANASNEAGVFQGQRAGEALAGRRDAREASEPVAGAGSHRSGPLRGLHDALLDQAAGAVDDRLLDRAGRPAERVLAFSLDSSVFLPSWPATERMPGSKSAIPRTKSGIGALRHLRGGLPEALAQHLGDFRHPEELGRPR